jgi:hypothetical protein
MVTPAASATRPSMRRTISRDSYVAAFTRLERATTAGTGGRTSVQCDAPKRSAVAQERGLYS